MKKIFIIAICLSMICSLLGACDQKKSEIQTEAQTEDTGIQLTLDNYDDYIEFDGSVEASSTTRCYHKGDWVYLCNYIECDIAAKGNSNYEYKNVIIGVRFYHVVPITGVTASEETIYIDLNLAGNGSASCRLETPANQEEYNNISQITYTFYSSIGIDSALDNTYYEIISITGSVVKN